MVTQRADLTPDNDKSGGRPQVRRARLGSPPGVIVLLSECAPLTA
jgi:hypothetical protein